MGVLVLRDSCGVAHGGWWAAGSLQPLGVGCRRSLSVSLMEVLHSVHVCLAAAGRRPSLTHLLSLALGDSFPAVLGHGALLQGHRGPWRVRGGGGGRQKAGPEHL